MDEAEIQKEIERRKKRAKDLKLREMLWKLYDSHLSRYPDTLQKEPETLHPDIRDNVAIENGYYRFRVGDVAYIALVDLATGERKILPAPAYKSLVGITCSTKTGRLLLVTIHEGRYSLWSMKSDGSEQRKLVEAESEVTLQSARWSPAGDAVYYFRQRGDTAELIRLPVFG